MKTAKKSSKTLLTRVSEVFTKQEPPAPVPVLPSAAAVAKAAKILQEADIPDNISVAQLSETVCSVNPVEAQTRETF